MQQYRKNLGKVSLTAEGAWNLNNSYDILSIVYDEHTQHGFISRKAVPQGVDLYNKEYWMPLNVSGYADNNVIILSKKTSEASIQSYTLEEAIASIKSVGRRPGAILGFYNENNDRLDIGGRWELWQFNDTNIYNWENVDSWQNLYYNYNKFMGWFKDENLLTKYAPFPEIGCYAFVGSEFNEATVYRCDNKYVWNSTTQHAWDYVKVIVDGNVTVGENGNWFNNGEDTGIPASVKGENGKTPIFREKNNTIQYSFDNANWITISDKVAAWFRWNATTGDTQANNVGRIQISRDNVTWTNLSGDIINNLHISRYTGADETLPTSGIAEGTIYAKGPTYADGDTSQANPIYRLWVYAWKGNTLAWQDNGEFTSIAAGVVQKTGDSETEVMSQKALTNYLEYTTSNTLNKYIVRIFVENKENAINDGLSLTYIDYKYNAFYLGTIEGGDTAITFSMKSLENGNRYIDITHDVYGIIYIEVLGGDGIQHRTEKNKNLTDKCFDKTVYEIVKCCNQIYLNKINIEGNNFAIKGCPEGSVYCTDNTINADIKKLYIENRGNAIENGLYISLLQYSYNSVYFGEKGEHNSFYISISKDTLEGTKTHPIYGKIYIQLNGLDKTDKNSEPSSYNIGELSFLKNPDGLENFGSVITERIDEVLYGIHNKGVYCTNENINKYIDFLYIENKSWAKEHNLFISLIQLNYNSLWFGYDGQSNNTVVEFNSKGEFNSINENLGVVKGRLLLETLTDNIATSSTSYNIGDIVYNQFAKEGINKALEKALNSSGSSKWVGKKLLAIGDSITAAQKWQLKVGELLGMDVKTHALGGIGIIAMVDGNNSIGALNSNDVKDVDIITISGFYNERDIAISNPGGESDMYPTSNSFVGKLNYAISKIYAKLEEVGNSKCKVVVISAHKYGKYEYINRDSYTNVSVNGKDTTDGEALFEATKLAANYNSLFFIDLMHNGNINKYNWNYYQASNTPYNPKYIPSDGINDGTNKPFASLTDAPLAADNDGMYITISNVWGSYKSEGGEWIKKDAPYIWNADQLHLNDDGYYRIGEYIAGQLLTI